MQARLFKNRINSNKTMLETCVEWHTDLTPALEQEITRINVQAFTELYAPYSATELGLAAETTKADFIRRLVDEPIAAFKQGQHHIATISLLDKVVGFVMCTNINSRDVFISLIAVKPLHYLSGKHAKINIGLGTQLIESVINKFPDANTVKLDTRTLNYSGIDFYRHLGFQIHENKTFGGSSPLYYVACQKVLPLRRMI